MAERTEKGDVEAIKRKQNPGGNARTNGPYGDEEEEDDRERERKTVCKRSQCLRDRAQEAVEGCFWKKRANC